MRRHSIAAAIAALCLSPAAWAGFSIFESVGANPAQIEPARDGFRVAVGGGSIGGANGSFLTQRREINWDGVPDAFADTNFLPANFFNVTSPRGVVFSTPGTGFKVSANSGSATPGLFGFSSDFQVFSAQRLFTAVNSNITDVSFFIPGTTTVASTSAFGVVFTDVEVAGLTKIEFFDASNALIFTRNALAGANQGLSFVGAVADAGETIGRVRITAGLNTIVSNGVLGNASDDVVAMDDFLYATPRALAPVPEPESYALLLAGLVTIGAVLRRRQRAC